MKNTNLIYWISTILFAGFMIFTAIPNLILQKESVDFMHGILGYPEYFIHFLGAAKLLGGIALLVPGFARIKEWAYAGLFFDLIGALFSVVMVTKTFDFGLIIILLVIAVGAVSYIYFRKRISNA